MGFFSDLFKSKHDWPYDELGALASVLTAMSLADGELDEREKELVTSAIQKLDNSQSVQSGEDFAEAILSTPPETCFKVLNNMHTLKKKVVIGLLGLQAVADGEIHEHEDYFFKRMQQILKVKL